MKRKPLRLVYSKTCRVLQLRKGHEPDGANVACHYSHWSKRDNNEERYWGWSSTLWKWLLPALLALDYIDVSGSVRGEPCKWLKKQGVL